MIGTPPPLLYIVIPCYNEELVLPTTSCLFLDELLLLIEKQKISPLSRILFVDDGSTDTSWSIIQELAETSPHFSGVALSRNRGHQNALLAGLMEAKNHCDICISIDCDGQDDIAAMEKMVDAYLLGSDIVYGVRNDRSSDSFLKRTTARGFYRFMRAMGVESVYDHADYRLLSNQVLIELEKYQEVNLFLRGMIPLIGFRSTAVSYARKPRMGGDSHYPFSKMLSLALDGITSLSIRPIRIVSGIGLATALLSLVGILWALISSAIGTTVSGWASLICVVFFIGGIQLSSLGLVGEYIGKIYLETKQRPRFIIEQRTATNIDTAQSEV